MCNIYKGGCVCVCVAHTTWKAQPVFFSGIFLRISLCLTRRRQQLPTCALLQRTHNACATNTTVIRISIVVICVDACGVAAKNFCALTCDYNFFWFYFCRLHFLMLTLLVLPQVVRRIKCDVIKLCGGATASATSTCIAAESLRTCNALQRRAQCVCVWHIHSCWLLAPSYLLKALHCAR